MSTTTSDAKPSGAAHAPGSIDEAAMSFQGLLSPTGAPKKPGEGTPKPKGTPAVEETTEPEEPEGEESEATEEEPEAEVTDEPEETEGDEPKATEGEPESKDEEPADEDETEEPEPTVKGRKMQFPDGTEEVVSEDEAYAGYLRTKDYTRKSQANAAIRKEAEEARAAARDTVAQYAQQLAQVKQAMDRMVPKEPDWTDLRKRLSPAEFADTLADWQAFSKNRTEVEAAQQKVAERQQADFEESYGKYRQGEVEKLFLAIPEWSNPERGKQDASAMAAYALSIGYSKEEVDHAVDSRVLLMLRKAMLWDKAQSSGAGKVKPKITSKDGIKSAPAGGVKTRPKPLSEEKRAKESLRKAGSMDAAAGVFSHILKRTGTARRD